MNMATNGTSTTTTTRESLTKMKRSQIQALAKEHGLKANKKTAVLIDMILCAIEEDTTETKGQTEGSEIEELEVHVDNTNNNNNNNENEEKAIEEEEESYEEIDANTMQEITAPSLEELSLMSRKELQAMCKDKYLKASGKTKGLVARLYDHFVATTAATTSSASTIDMPATTTTIITTTTTEPKAVVEEEDVQLDIVTEEEVVAETIDKEDGMKKVVETKTQEDGETSRRRSKRLSSEMTKKKRGTDNTSEEPIATKRRRSKRLSSEHISSTSPAVAKHPPQMNRQRKKIKTPSKAVPNFRKLHAQIFSKQEKLVDYASRTGKQGKYTTVVSAASRSTPNKLDGAAAKRVVTRTPKSTLKKGASRILSTKKKMTPGSTKTGGAYQAPKPYMVMKSMKPLTEIEEFKLSKSTVKKKSSRSLTSAVKSSAVTVNNRTTTKMTMSKTTPKNLNIKAAGKTATGGKMSTATKTRVLGSTKGVSAKKTFNLKESLQRPIKWKMHSGKFIYNKKDAIDGETASNGENANTSSGAINIIDRISRKTAAIQRKGLNKGTVVAKNLSAVVIKATEKQKSIREKRNAEKLSQRRLISASKTNSIVKA